MPGGGASGRMGVGLLFAVVVVGLDQLSKWFASRDLVGEMIVLVPGFFDLVLVHNVGAAFGMFTGAEPLIRVVFLCSVAVVASGVILYLLRQAHSGLYAFALGMVLGGALGNLIDRVRFGWVVDFLHLHWHEWSFPVFNLADSAITLGVGLLVFEHLKLSEDSDSRGVS